MTPTLTVWKYPIVLTDIFTVEMPQGAQILTVQVQASAHGVMLWALVNPAHPVEARTFRLVDTGQPLEEPLTDLRYIGSCQLEQGGVVLHLFEIRQPGRP